MKTSASPFYSHRDNQSVLPNRHAVFVFTLLFVIMLSAGCKTQPIPYCKNPNNTQQMIAGLVVDSDGNGKTITEEEVSLLHEVLKKRKWIGRQPFVEGRHPRNVYVYVRIMKEEPKVFGIQYEFSWDFRYVLIRVRQGFVHADPDIMYFELDEDARNQIANICTYFPTEERKEAFYFNGKSLDSISDWHSLIEPWVETDETIGGDFNFPQEEPKWTFSLDEKCSDYIPTWSPLIEP